MCEYCSSKSEKGNPVILADVYNGMWYIDSENDLCHETEEESNCLTINYCPMCGEKLDAANN